MKHEAKDKLIEFAMRARHTFLIAGDLREELDSFYLDKIDDGDEMDQLFRVALEKASVARVTLGELHNKIREIVENVREQA
ncbi:hypothetical protein AB3G45_22435 [Shinella sp. S4-D37]|uniref:hypothetical protein n=1 Tax=Shinella sp. S4-D37 TaxID=3161999 RepID=UPI003465C545